MPDGEDAQIRKVLMNSRIRLIVVSLRLGAVTLMVVTVYLLSRVMLWLPWQADCLIAAARVARVCLPIRAGAIPLTDYRICQIEDRRRFATLVLPGHCGRSPKGRTGRPVHQAPWWKVHVPHGGGLLLDACLSAEHRVFWRPPGLLSPIATFAPGSAHACSARFRCITGLPSRARTVRAAS